MKRLIAMLSIALIAAFSFTGCGENNIDNAGSEAGELVSDAGETVSKSVSDMMSNTDGDVTDETNDNENVD